MGASSNNGQPTDNYQSTPTSGFGPAPAQPDYTADARARGRGQGVYNATVQPGYIPAPNTDFGGPGGTTYQPPAIQNTGNPYQGILSALQGLFGGGYSGGGYGSEDDLRQPQLPPGMAPGPTMSIGAPGAEYGGLGGTGTPLRDQLVPSPTFGPAPAPQVPGQGVNPPDGILPVPAEGVMPLPPGTDTGSMLPVPPEQGTYLNPWGAEGIPDISQMTIDEFLRARTPGSPMAAQFNLQDWTRARRDAGFDTGVGIIDPYINNLYG